MATTAGDAGPPPEPIGPTARAEGITPDQWRRLRRARRVRYAANLVPSAFHYLRLSHVERQLRRQNLKEC